MITVLTGPKQQQQQQPKKPATATAFNENSTAYRCCCGRYHLKKGTVLACLFELLAVYAVVIYCVITYLTHPDYLKATKENSTGWSNVELAAMVLSSAAAIVWTLCVILTVIGVYRSSPTLLIPHLIVEVMSVLGLAGLFSLFVWSAVQLDSKDDPDRRTTTALVVFCILAALALIFLCLQTYFFIVVQQCYRFLKVKCVHLQQQKRMLARFD